jgi:anaerobic C4-dicarboxylate transporter
MITSGNDRMLLNYVTKKLEANAVSYSIFPAVSDSAHMAQIKDDKPLALVSSTEIEILAGKSDYMFCPS